jgi:Gluconate 2-dehydrogenase subunit 3
MDTSRRVFLGVGAVAPALVSAIQPAANPVLQADEQTTLKTIMDLIIPEGDGMPSATQAGGFAYLQGLVQRDKSVAADLAKELAVVEALSERAFEKPFRQLGKEQQITVLKQMENAAPKLFDGLRAYVYESYYTQPAVWKLIGYELYPTDHEGPHLKPFDESLIADVRAKPKLYRDA